jgi:hypothetical protein
MCCDPPGGERLPPEVAAMLEGYRALVAERPQDWSEESEGYRRAQPYARWLGNRPVAAVFSSQGEDWPGAVRACLEDPPPAGLTVATVDAGGLRLRAGPVPYVPEGSTAEVAVLLDCSLSEATQVEVGRRPVPVAVYSARWLLDWLDRFEALLGGHGRFADDGQRAEVMAVVDQARALYRAVAAPVGLRRTSVRLG